MNPKHYWNRTKEKTKSSAKALYESPYAQGLTKWGIIGSLVLSIIVFLFRNPEMTPTKREDGVKEPGSLSQGPEVSVPEVGGFNASPFTRTDAMGTGPGGKQGGGMGRSLPGPALIARPRTIKISPGSIAKAMLLSGASNGVVRAELLEPVSANGERLVQAGWTIVGSGHSTEERLFIVFNQMVTKEGEIIAVSAQAIDGGDQTVGLKGSRVSHYVARFVGGAGLSFLAGMADSLQDHEVMGGVEVKIPSIRNGLLQGTESAALEESRQHLEKMKNETPIIEVPAGTEIAVMFTGEGG